MCCSLVTIRDVMSHKRDTFCHGYVTSCHKCVTDTLSYCHTLVMKCGPLAGLVTGHITKVGCKSHYFDIRCRFYPFSLIFFWMWFIRAMKYVYIILLGCTQPLWSYAKFGCKSYYFITTFFYKVLILFIFFNFLILNAIY